MTKTIPANYIGQQNLGYILLALPSENFKNRISALLSELTTALPGVIWPMPPEQLHITLCEIIQPKDYSQDKESLFKQHQDQYQNIPAEILSKTPMFTVTFDTIEVSPQAIIIKASDSSAFNAIRAQLVSAVPFPEETRMPPDITHCSIARYLKEVEQDTVQQIVSKHNLAIEEEITEFKLVKTISLPLQDYEILKALPLAVG